MEYFEYLRQRSDVPLEALELNESGANGWELVAIICNVDVWYYYFKRRYYVS